MCIEMIFSLLVTSLKPRGKRWVSFYSVQPAVFKFIALDSVSPLMRQQVGRNSKAYCAKANYVHYISQQFNLPVQQTNMTLPWQINGKK